MANRFSDIAKQMGAKVDEEVTDEISQKPTENELFSSEPKVKTTPNPKSRKGGIGINSSQENEIPTTRKTTALPLVLDIAIKEVKERRNIVSKIKSLKKITEDDVVIEALELYFKKAENKSYLEAAYEKLRYLE